MILCTLFFVSLQRFVHIASWSKSDDGILSINTTKYESQRSFSDSIQCLESSKFFDIEIIELSRSNGTNDHEPEIAFFLRECRYCFEKLIHTLYFLIMNESCIFLSSYSNKRTFKLVKREALWKIYIRSIFCLYRNATISRYIGSYTNQWVIFSICDILCLNERANISLDNTSISLIHCIDWLDYKTISLCTSYEFIGSKLLPPFLRKSNLTRIEHIESIVHNLYN